MVERDYHVMDLEGAERRLMNKPIGWRPVLGGGLASFAHVLLEEALAERSAAAGFSGAELAGGQPPFHGPEAGLAVKGRVRAERGKGAMLSGSSARKI